MTTVTGTLTEPDGSVASGRVRFYLAGEHGRKVPNAFLASGTGSIVRESAVVLNGSGAYSVSLTANDLILPAGTRWARVHGTTAPAFLHVPTTGPVSEDDILADPPATLESAALSLHAANTALHGGGLWSAVKSDSTFATTSTTDVPITGWSASSTVPARPWEIEATVEALGGAGAGDGGSLTIYIDLPITAIARTGNVVTATLASGHGVLTGAPVLADLSDNTFDGAFTVTGATATTVTWAQVAADDPDGGTGTLSVRVGVTSSWRAAVATLRAYARFPDIWWSPAAGVTYTARPRVRASAGTATLLSGTFFGSPSQAVMVAR